MLIIQINLSLFRPHNCLNEAPHDSYEDGKLKNSVQSSGYYPFLCLADGYFCSDW